MTSDKCPVCGTPLDKEIIIGSRDEMIVSCENCGKYGMTRVYYEDYIETAQSETWTAKQYSGSVDKKITKFKKAIRSGSTKTARQILEDSSFKRN